jgi:hypothetical protein
MTIEERVENFADEVARGNIAFDQVRKKLESEGVEEETIRKMVRMVDDEVQRRLLAQNKKFGSSQLIMAGLFLTGVGLIVTIGSLLGFFVLGKSIVIIAYGPFLGGLVILFAGIRRKNRKKISKEFSDRLKRRRQDREGI